MERERITWTGSIARICTAALTRTPACTSIHAYRLLLKRTVCWWIEEKEIGRPRSRGENAFCNVVVTLVGNCLFIGLSRRWSDFFPAPFSGSVILFDSVPLPSITSIRFCPRDAGDRSSLDLLMGGNLSPGCETR